MATLQSNIVCDSSTLANFKAWAQAISTAFSTFGWVQTADTGQVNWGSIAVIPTGATWVYEVWKPGDALTVFYVKIEYGNNGTTNSPTIRLSLGTTTNGAGTLTGFTFGPTRCANDTFTAPSSVTQYECSFSGSTSRISAMMWRNGINSCQQFFAIERSLDTSGAYTSTYATLWTIGITSANGQPMSQQSLIFAVGAGQASNAGAANQTWGVRIAGNNTGLFNNSIAFDTCAPTVGYFDNPCTICGSVWGGDITEAVAFSSVVYGVTRTYYPSKQTLFNKAGPGFNQTAYALIMRYD